MGRLIRRKKKPQDNVVPYNVLYQKQFIRDRQRRVKELREQAMVSRERKMAFGKYRGLKFKEISGSYIKWLYEQDWLKEQHPRIHKHVDILMRYSFVQTPLQFFEDELQDLLKVKEGVDQKINEVMGWIEEEKGLREADYE